MGMAYATNGPAGGGFSAFIPLLIMGIFFAILLYHIAKRKGRHKWLWFIAGFVPIWNIIGGIWLASFPDKYLIEEVSTLVDELQKFNFVPKDNSHSSKPEVNISDD